MVVIMPRHNNNHFSLRVHTESKCQTLKVHWLNQWFTDLKIRQEKSLPVINAIRKLIDDNINKIVPRSKLGSAFGYISNEWPHLEHFLNNGNISLSNNRVENAIRPFAIGRKNWLFSDTIEGAEASAAIYSLITSVREFNFFS